MSAAADPFGLDRPALVGALRRMDRRVWELGLARFDPNDVPSHPSLVPLASGRRRYLLYPVKLWDLHAPVLCRRVLGIQPRLVPTALSHLGLAHLYWTSLPPDERPERLDRVDALAGRALATRLPGDPAAWAHPHASHGYAHRRLRGPGRRGIPDSCAHHTARLGLFLRRAGLLQSDDRLVRMGGAAARALLLYHRWQLAEDGTATVSYYPDTDDEILNVAAEAALLLAAANSGPRRSAKVAELVSGVVRLLIHEQRPEGGWNYTTAAHARTRAGGMGSDNHHQAMIVAALGELLAEDLVDAELADDALTAMVLGLSYYLDAFCSPSGRCTLAPGRGREAPVAGYAEGIRAMLAAWRALPEGDPLGHRIAGQVGANLRHAHRMFLEPGTGDVACLRRQGRSYNIRSIRWGCGPLMEATAEVLAWPRRLPLRASAP